MYAIIDDNGKQYKAAQGDILYVDVRPLADEQSEIEFDQVLYYRDDQTTLVGQPLVAGAKVVATINGQVAGPKLHPMHFSKRKNSRRRIGHRQKYLEVAITDIRKSQ